MDKYLHIKRHQIPLYRGLLVLILTNSKEELLKHLPVFDSNIIYAHSWFAEHKKRQGFYIILNFNSEHRKIKPGIITHEAIHTANMIADYRGIDASFENDEPIAYLAEWITDKTYEMAEKYGFEIKP